MGVGVRLATSNTNDRVSTNQTLGQGFNKYQLLVDRAFIQSRSAGSLTVHAAACPTPFATEMVWSDNLNFEGLAATLRRVPEEGTFAIRHHGLVPSREASKPARGSRASLTGAQVGLSWEPASHACQGRFGHLFIQRTSQASKTWTTSPTARR